MEYNSEITETLSRQITIQSSSVEDVHRIVKDLYNDEKIVLNASDFIEVDIYGERKDLSQTLNRSISPFFRSSDRAFTLLHGDCIELLKQFNFKFDMIFADPPYFLSNGGISVQSGKVVCVDKGEWDKGGTPEYVDAFNRAHG